VLDSPRISGSMNNEKFISSSQNAWFKWLRSLIEKNRNRKKEGIIIVEGLKEIELALASSFQLTEWVYCPDFISPEKLIDTFGEKAFESVPINQVTEPLWKSLTVREDVENAMALFRFPENKVPFDLNQLKSDGLYLVVEGVEKPGNLGAVLRTAEAVNLDGVLICDSRIDAFHPVVIRNSLGCSFRVPVTQCTSIEAIEALKNKQIQIFTTFMDGSIPAYHADFTQGTALVVGTEHEGVSDQWRGVGQNINLPMLGVIDSLNVSVAAAVLMYEAIRQRQFR